MTFRDTLARHLDAIRRRDLDTLRDTLPDRELTLVMADGRLVRSVEEFLTLHRDWFRSDTWTLDAATVSLVEGQDLGLAVLRLVYRDTPREGSPIHECSLLTLVFQRQGDRWVMVHDQNTPIRNPAPAPAGQ